MKLIIAKPSPYARKAHITLLEKSIDCDIIVDNPWLPDAKIAQANPLAKVPALLLDDGNVVHDSKVIVEYLETLDAPPALIPAESQQRIAHKQLETIADGICDAVVLIALERTRAADKRSDAWLERQRSKIIAGVAELERQLAGREWFADSGFGLAEIATVCALDYLDFRYPEYDWRTQVPALVGLHDRLSRRHSFAATMPQPQILPGL
ncbi:MAG: glutathione S-transferase N-terminal domain-containing protein [Betaproteobacteria bacterium]|nr:MAG: glutathione S-transferase N-terminal domain-containing protein [Betaproteobacteria bacterium]